MNNLKVDKITCHYDGDAVFSSLSFQIATGELACLLGPSGCGKTTALRTIAGFEPVQEGTISLNNQEIATSNYSLAPEKRNIGMVFQDYALFPHKNVIDNVRFGLRSLAKNEQQHRVQELLEIVGLEAVGQRYPHELSGGQQQRVALARALAPRPALILLDEPFSNLDVELREKLSLEVREILKDQGMTGLLVTHDQHEAFAWGDKIGVMSEGKILQWDTAYRLYHQPTNRFIADFVGQGEFLRGKLIAPHTLETELGVLSGVQYLHDAQIGSELDILVRPDAVLCEQQSDLLTTVKYKAFKGSETLYTLQLPSGRQLLSLIPSWNDRPLGSQMGVRLATDHLVAFAAS